ncbi:hypothetical protein EPR50_G00173730 [Perca flavescens]|uniref:Uncharacterized protein n=1 Tax=Perca flavescens TaxID=8167 RepID=A0A484CFY8_PERFV|nr:hypothetical protein EPR50_G00173730 [Perca flavescens]
MSESRSVKKVEELAEDFMKIVEALKKNLEEIKRMCEKLEKRSAELQAGKTLRDMEVFQRILRVVEEFQRSLSIPGRSDGVSTTWEVFRVTATPEEDRKLRDSIIQSADLCEEIIDDLKKMKEELKDFTEQ